jgi:hypothetical protein
MCPEHLNTAADVPEDAIKIETTIAAAMSFPEPMPPPPSVRETIQYSYKGTEFCLQITTTSRNY